MSALKHGFFRVGFMLCDRCVLNARCERFVPGGECVLEREAYEETVKKLMDQYGLEGLADEILASRVAMYLIRIARVEGYESTVGVTDKSVLLGKYITQLDNTLRRLMNDLAVTRAKRKQFEKSERLMVGVDDLLKKFIRECEPRTKKRRVCRREPAKRRAKKHVVVERRGRKVVIMEALLKDWRRESRRLRQIIERGEKGGEEKEDS